jgi:hypothetical protein
VRLGGGHLYTARTNPQQIGLGVQLATIDVMDTEAYSQYTESRLIWLSTGTVIA